MQGFGGFFFFQLEVGGSKIRKIFEEYSQETKLTIAGDTIIRTGIASQTATEIRPLGVRTGL